ncbi:hypothetical protein AB6F95_004643 [Salmonella enterica]
MINEKEVMEKFSENKSKRDLINKIISFVEVGVEYKYISAQLGVTEEFIESVYQYQSKYAGTKKSLLLQMKENKKQLIVERNKNIVDAYKSGEHVLDICLKFNLCKSSIYTILEKAGIRVYTKWIPKEF